MMRHTMRAVTLTIAIVVAGCPLSVASDRYSTCAKWGYERLVLGMPLERAARVNPPTEAPLSRYENREEAGDRVEYPWVNRGEESIHVILDHSLPGNPIMGIRAITLAEGGRRLAEFLQWWPNPDEVYEGGGVAHYIWNDEECDVRATLTLVVDNNRILISIVQQTRP